MPPASRCVHCNSNLATALASKYFEPLLRVNISACSASARRQRPFVARSPLFSRCHTTALILSCFPPTAPPPSPLLLQAYRYSLSISPVAQPPPLRRLSLDVVTKNVKTITPTSETRNEVARIKLLLKRRMQRSDHVGGTCCFLQFKGIASGEMREHSLLHKNRDSGGIAPHKSAKKLHASHDREYCHCDCSGNAGGGEQATTPTQLLLAKRPPEQRIARWIRQLRSKRRQFIPQR
jgi:hypothetical protein